jgi:hypothetical protein
MQPITGAGRFNYFNQLQNQFAVPLITVKLIIGAPVSAVAVLILEIRILKVPAVTVETVNIEVFAVGPD